MELKRERAEETTKTGSDVPMSALGQKQTFAVQKGMSALPPKADMVQHGWDVASVRYCLVLFGGGSGGSQAESSGPEASASIRAAITKSDSCNPPIFRVVNDTSQKPHPNASSG